MRKLLIVTLALVFVLGLSGLAMADNVIDIDQTGTPANATVIQDEGINQSSIIIVQIGGSAATTGLVNDVWAKQKRYGPYKMDVYQKAGTYNYAWLYQCLGGRSEIKAVQNAGTGDNYLRADQSNWMYNYIDIKQTAGTWNYADLLQGYYMNDMFIEQEALYSNKADVKQNKWGGKESMYIYGADSSGAIADKTPAKQISYWRYNELSINQYDDDKVGLYQEANGYNYADIDQTGGGNRLGVYQKASNRMNDLIVTQNGKGTAKVVQDADTYNYADVYQNSSAKLVGANSDGTINYGAAATQISANEDNWLKTHQSGDNNEIGLYQSALGYNFADISQMGNNNSLGVYQFNDGGYNSVIATQCGNSSATVVQTTTSGNGTIIVNQS